jgi:hypothetical protein
MDRLEEANKVTSLMRRRENPRHISAARLMCNSALERRGFFEAKNPGGRAEMASFSRVPPAPASPRVASGADRYVAPRAARLKATESSRRLDPSRIHINGRGMLPLVPPRRQKLRVQISQAPIVTLRCDTPAPNAVPRDFGMLRQGEIRVHFGSAMAPGSLGPRHALTLVNRAHPRKVGSSAVEGKALRVSIGIGFRVPPTRWRDYFNRPPLSSGLVWPQIPHRILPGCHDAAAEYRNLEMAISRWRTCLPEVADGTAPARFVFPGTLAPRNRRAANGDHPVHRTADIMWKPSEPRSKGMAVVPPSAGFARRNGAHLFRLSLSPTLTNATRQVAFTAFVPQEPVGCPKVAFEGTVAAAIAGSPGSGSGGAEVTVMHPATPAPPAEVVRIEEHFGSGWGDWVGGMKEWLVDVAGVRTGPLALYAPTLELIDYELDFLARIDTRSLTWVVRAAGLDEYLRCTLTAVGGGELEFSRCAVIGGVAQPPVTAERRLPGKPRSAMTVNTSVSGDSFAVSVDGNNIDAWDDDRFPMGGVGFTGATDDRARLYWVRLSSTELTAKEQQTK